MANYMKHLGLDFLMETEEDVRSLWGYIAQEGTAITGYYGSPYLNLHFGDAQLILRTIRNEDERRFEVAGMDTHASGNCVWDVYLSQMNIARKEADKMERRCVVKRKSDGGGLAVVNIVNADVLPSFDENAEVKLQMIAFPDFIEYFQDEEEYAAAQPESRSGEKWILADGSMLPAGLMRNRNPESDEFESDEDLDDLMWIRGTVKHLYSGVVKLGDEEHPAYLRCIIGTEHGDLEIVHTIDEVEEEQRANIRVGATVSGVFTLSGDVAIYEYEKGIVLDETNDLSILRSTIAGADPERIRLVFAENATYLAEYNNAIYTGRDAIIERLKDVIDSAEDKIFAHLATIVSVDEGDEPLPYGTGKRCIVIAYGEEDNYNSIAFTDFDEEGRISKLTTCANPRYHFRIDEKPECRPSFDIKIPDSVAEPIVLRARLHGFIDDDITPENILHGIPNIGMYEYNVDMMLSSMPNDNEENTLKNLFGYMFAKAIEAAHSEREHEGIFKSRIVVSYAPEDAWNGEINTLFEPEKNEKIVTAMDMGKQFSRDFVLFHPVGEPHDDCYDADLRKALIIVQRLGALYEPKCMK